MNKARVFLEVARPSLPKRPVNERIRDWSEVEGDLVPGALQEQAARCMDCGIAFCHKGCPLGNHIPDWNDLVYRGALREAGESLHETNNFPEFTGRVCPAPCEEACVLNINNEPVVIRQIEKQIADRAWEENWASPRPPQSETGRTVAIAGSGPAGLAAAQQLRRVGHRVTVFERDDRVGGLLRYGIPDFKLEKEIIDRRVAQLEAEGVRFETGVCVGGTIALTKLTRDHDATLLCVGAQRARPLDIPGHDLAGVHEAMQYLTQQNRAIGGNRVANQISARGKRVVILGGGDTGADCLGTAHRQGAREVHHFHYKPAPPSERTAEMPWPWWPMTLRQTTSHEEGGKREWSVIPTEFIGDDQNRVRKLRCARVEWRSDEPDSPPRMHRLEGTEFDIDADLVLIAVGFMGAEVGAENGLDVAVAPSGNVRVDEQYRTGIEGVFAAGDATRGASLVVWAIWEGREMARAVDLYMQGDSQLPTSPNLHPI